MDVVGKAKAMRLREMQAGVERWHYLSFATTEKFLGGLLIRAYGKSDAVLSSHERKLNPGGSVMVLELADNFPAPPQYVDRLLTRTEVEKMGELLPERS